MHIGERSEVIKQKAMEQVDIINLRYTPYLYLGCNLHILAIFSIVQPTKHLSFECSNTVHKVQSSHNCSWFESNVYLIFKLIAVDFMTYHCHSIKFVVISVPII